ncbi:MAG: GGDEF domain-containing phosphodiesterase, partial [Pseudomonadota bacterium]
MVKVANDDAKRDGAARLNRRELEAWLATDRGPVSLVVATPARIKGVNRLYGHDAGDRMIEAFGARLSLAAPKGAVVARLSGAKFVVAAETDAPTATSDIAASLKRAASAASVDGARLDPRLGSAWVAETGICGPAPEEALGAALTALDEASAGLREEGEVTLLSRTAEEDELARARAALGAIRAGRASIALQPVVASDGSGRVLFREALIRVHGPDGAEVSAGLFMPILDRLGMTEEADVAALRLAFMELTRDETQRISVNLSAASIGRARWIEALEDLADGAPEAAERLIVEVTEEASLADRAAAAALFARVRATGAALALDDFGAGRTSFSQLRDFRFDMVKIDGGFIQDIDKSADNRMLVSALVAIARQFDMMVV